MNTQELEARLADALEAVQAAVAAHARAALAAEEGTGTATDLAKASKELAAAHQRASNLQAAIEAAHEAQNAEATAAQQLLAQQGQARLDAALREVRSVIAEWDEASNALAAVASRIVDVEQKLRNTPNASRILAALERARVNAIASVEQKARAWVGEPTLCFDPCALQLLAVLPEPSQG